MCVRAWVDTNVRFFGMHAPQDYCACMYVPMWLLTHTVSEQFVCLYTLGLCKYIRVCANTHTHKNIATFYET